MERAVSMYEMRGGSEDNRRSEDEEVKHGRHHNVNEGEEKKKERIVNVKRNVDKTTELIYTIPNGKGVIHQYNPLTFKISHILLNFTPTVPYWFGLAKVHDQFYICGGSDSTGAYFNTTYVVQSSFLINKQSMIMKRGYPSLLKCTHYLYALGGYDGIIHLQHCERFSLNQMGRNTQF